MPPSGKFINGSNRIVRGNVFAAKRARRRWYAESESKGRTRRPIRTSSRVWRRSATPTATEAAIPIPRPRSARRGIASIMGEAGGPRVSFPEIVKLSVLIPVYNEIRTIDEILRLVTAEPTEKEVVVVDDGSTDGTRGKLGDGGG